MGIEEKIRARIDELVLERERKVLAFKGEIQAYSAVINELEDLLKEGNDAGGTPPDTVGLPHTDLPDEGSEGAGDQVA